MGKTKVQEAYAAMVKECLYELMELLADRAPHGGVGKPIGALMLYEDDLIGLGGPGVEDMDFRRTLVRASLLACGEYPTTREELDEFARKRMQQALSELQAVATMQKITCYDDDNPVEYVGMVVAAEDALGTVARDRHPGGDGFARYVAKALLEHSTDLMVDLSTLPTAGNA